MKRRQYPRMMILAATIITALFLITPVCWAYNPPGGGGGSNGGSSGSTSSGSASAAGSGENTYSSTASSGTWTPAGNGWNMYEFRNSPTPVTKIAVKTPAAGITTRGDQVPLAYDISLMSSINTNKITSSVQGTPGQGTVTAGGPATGGQAPAGGTRPFYVGMAEAAARDPSYQKSATAFKFQPGIGFKISQYAGPDIDYTYSPNAKLTVNTPAYQQKALTDQSRLGETHTIRLSSHKITLGVAYHI